MEQSLKTLLNIIGSKYSTVLKSSYKDSNFPVQLELDPTFNYELGMIFFSVYNTIFNITDANNVFRYKEKEADEWRIWKVTPGAYEMKNLDSYLKTVFPDKVKLEPEQTSCKCKMTTNLFIDFSHQTSFANLIGFDLAVYELRN